MSEPDDTTSGAPTDDGSTQGAPVEDVPSRDIDALQVTPGSIRSERRHRVPADGPTHPRLAANLLMAGIVLLLVAIAAAPLIGR